MKVTLLACFGVVVKRTNFYNRMLMECQITLMNIIIQIDYHRIDLPDSWIVYMGNHSIEVGHTINE